MKYRVLLIDDEKASYEFVEDILMMSSEDRFELHWESEFDAAVQAILSGNHDVCLLDYNLGEYTGFELMKHVLERGVRMPIIILTGHGNREVDMGALQAGAAEYLDKSQLKPILVARTIRYAVRRQRDKNELEDLYKHVRELEQLKTDMIRIAAHDLRTPLMTMLNYAHFLERDTDHPLQAYQVDYVQNIVSSVYKMQQIISEILSLERIQETANERYQQQANLNELVKQALENAVPPNRDLTLTSNIPQTPLIIQGEPAQLREAATNIIGNAVKYTPDGGNITITLQQEGNQVVFQVKDTGYGIPEDLQDRLFEPFYRAGTKETRRINGTGLGLYLVRNIIRRHGGEIIFQSVYHQGSTFGFRVPLLQPS